MSEGSAADSEKVDGVVKALVDDYDRQDGCLLRRQVEKLLTKKSLDSAECMQVFQQLEDLGISLDDEFEEKVELEEESDIDEKEVERSARDYIADKPAWYDKAIAKLLRPEEETELGRKIELSSRIKAENKDKIQLSDDLRRIIREGEQARDRMILANVRLVLYNIRSYASFTDIGIDDLAQEGTLGLMKAVEKFDYKLGYKFSTYATWWIRQAVTRAIADKGDLVRLPYHVHEDVRRLRKAYKLFDQLYPARNVRVSELADELNWTIDKVHFMQQISAFTPASLDTQLPGYEGLTLQDTLICNADGPSDYVEKLALRGYIEKELDNLSEREKRILNSRFGLNSKEESLTLEVIGKQFGVTRERIRQIEAKAIRKLRKRALRKDGCLLADYHDGEDDEEEVKEVEAQDRSTTSQSLDHAAEKDEDGYSEELSEG